nr:hypothetical protein [Desulfobacula sp.]
MTESSRIEYKRELSDSLEKEVFAFLNAHEGGMIWIGVDNSGEAVAGGLEKLYYLKKYGMTEKGCFLRVGSAAEPMPQDKPNFAAYLLADENGVSPKFEFFKDRLEITSSGGLPYGVTLDDFFGGYSSPRNKEIMRVFRDLELVEQLGSGVPRILEKYDRSVFEIFPNFLRVIFHYAKPFGAEAQVEAQVGLTAWQAEILKACTHKEKSSRDLVEALGYSNRTGHFKRGLQGLLEKGLLEMTRPETPKSRLQKYRLTGKGRALLDQFMNDKNR